MPAWAIGLCVVLLMCAKWALIAYAIWLVTRDDG